MPTIILITLAKILFRMLKNEVRNQEFVNGCTPPINPEVFFVGLKEKVSRIKVMSKIVLETTREIVNADKNSKIHFSIFFLKIRNKNYSMTIPAKPKQLL